ncbi:unnamed protein product [Ranitomeya imitator]|uniref:Uncharacterized protein n=1 Tax=Ranitomeya imitator TaxID=111125 RepID=A0ABN9MKJ0_9NEOB|nr:unnamed protein product [Ranitomeya imitator]
MQESANDMQVLKSQGEESAGEKTSFKSKAEDRKKTHSSFQESEPRKRHLESKSGEVIVMKKLLQEEGQEPKLIKRLDQNTRPIPQPSTVSESKTENIESTFSYSKSLPSSSEAKTLPGSSSQVTSTTERPSSSDSNSAHTPLSATESPLSLLLIELHGIRRERSDLQGRYDSILRDLQRQEGELERMQRELRRGRNAMRVLKQEHRELQERFSQLSIQGEQIQQERHRKVQEQMDKAQEFHLENQRLQDEHKRLQEELYRLEKTFTEKTSELREMKRQLGSEQRQREQLERERMELKETVQRMEISNTGLSDQCQVLSQVKFTLQEQNSHLLSQINTLTQDNRELLEKSLESGALRQEEERCYREKLTELKHEKQKLLDKIMDQYRVLEPAPAAHSHKRSNWITDKMKRLLKTKEKPARGPGDVTRFLNPPKEPSLELDSPTKSGDVALRRSRSSLSVSSQSYQAASPRFRRMKLSSTIRSSESFSGADSSPRDKFRLRQSRRVQDSEEDDTGSEGKRDSKGEEMS